MTLFEKILASRGLTTRAAREEFLHPNYASVKHDPFLLPDMKKAVDRLKKAHTEGEKIVIYGDYDIDGLSATAILLDAFGKFGFEEVGAFIPNRFVEGYGMTMGAVDKVRNMGADLIVTVDTGSLCHAEIEYASSLGIDTVVTDHHNVAETPPPSVAAVNPKFPGHKYPFRDLCGAGVAFKLVQALQTELDGLPDGYEKWLLDLVALGTVCDIVTLADENRANVYWGLEVLKKQKRPGLKALMSVAGIDPERVNARHLGFGLGPRMNAAGRLETAQYALDMLTASDGLEALEASEKLEELNIKRRSIQDEIFDEACQQADNMADDRVLVVNSGNWNHGVIGIVASKLVEKYKKPVFIIGERGDEATGSARSFGDFSAADAVRAADDIIIKGGGHGAAAGVTLATERIDDFRRRVNEFYDSLQLKNQELYLLPRADVEIDDFSEINEELIDNLAKMEPFGNGNAEPILKITKATVLSVRRMGADGQHVKLTLRDKNDVALQMLAFNAPEEFFREAGDVASAWFQPTINEWQGMKSVEGRLLHLAEGFFGRFGNMEFSNSGSEIIYQKDTHTSLGRVALKLLTNYHEDTRSELPGKALADLKEEYDDVAGKHKEFAEHLNEASSLSSLVAAAGHLISLKDVMYEINNGVQLSLSSDANGEVPGDSALPENIPCDLAKVKISENDDGTYTAKIPVTEHRFDCNRHIRADVTTYTITFTPDGEVLNLTSKKVKG